VQYPKFLFAFSKFQCTIDLPILVANFGWRVNHIKHFKKPRFLNFIWGCLLPRRNLVNGFSLGSGINSPWPNPATYSRLDLSNIKTIMDLYWCVCACVRVCAWICKINRFNLQALCRNVGSSNISSSVPVILTLLVASLFLFLFLACFLAFVSSERGVQCYSDAKKEEIRKLWLHGYIRRTVKTNTLIKQTCTWHFNCIFRTMAEAIWRQWMYEFRKAGITCSWEHNTCL
jgi:hypothetical protein